MRRTANLHHQSDTASAEDIQAYVFGFAPLPLIVRSSDIHAAGCYTTIDIPQGTPVVEYTGRWITAEEGNRRYEGKEITFLFGLDDDKYVIDGHGMGAFLNHSCDPNCVTDVLGGRVWIFAKRDINAGEELTYDYCLYDGEPGDAPCTCGAKKCRGSMYSPEELRRQAQQTKKQKRAEAKRPRQKKKAA